MHPGVGVAGDKTGRDLAQGRARARQDAALDGDARQERHDRLGNRFHVDRPIDGRAPEGPRKGAIAVTDEDQRVKLRQALGLRCDLCKPVHSGRGIDPPGDRGRSGDHSTQRKEPAPIRVVLCHAVFSLIRACPHRASEEFSRRPRSRFIPLTRPRGGSPWFRRWRSPAHPAPSGISAAASSAPAGR